MAVCQSATVELDPAGTATISPALVDNGSTADCGLQSIIVTPSSVACANIGTVTVTLTVTDDNGSTKTCEATVTVEDNLDPVLSTCPVTRNVMGCNTGAITGPAYSTSSAASSYAEFSNATNQGLASDNCGITEVSYQDAAVGTCLIIVTRTWTLKDASGNSTTCPQTINVNAPAVSIICPNDAIEAACQSQGVINTAFSTWLGSFSFTGGCGASGSFDGGSPVAPLACGGSVTVTYRVTSTCEVDAVCTKCLP